MRAGVKLPLPALGGQGGLDADGWHDRVTTVRASCAGTWELPAIGTVPAPAAVLIRPDGYVAWVGDGSATGLTDALTRWFGAPTSITCPEDTAGDALQEQRR